MARRNAPGSPVAAGSFTPTEPVCATVAHRARDWRRAERELLDAFLPLGDSRLGAAVQADRGSALRHLGVAMPALRARVRRGFGFTSGNAAQTLAAWDSLWRNSEVAEVLFAALIHHEAIVRSRALAAQASTLWAVLQHWPARIDNWCHSDMLAGVISRLLAAEPGLVLPTLRGWIGPGPGPAPLWPRRLGLTCLVRGSGVHSAFLPAATVLPLVLPCVPDTRHFVQLGLGWVLREMRRAEPQVLDDFIARHAAAMGATAYARALEKHAPAERQRLHALRRAAQGAGL